MNRIPESDWKQFRVLREKALEQLCEGILKESISVATDASRGKQDRYHALYQLITDRNEDLARMFDAVSRGHATFQLCQMVAYGLVSEEELEPFTEETKGAVQHFVRSIQGS